MAAGFATDTVGSEGEGAFAREVFSFADSNAIRRVVVDLRSNSGGNSEIIKPLLDGLKVRPSLWAKGHLYVLIGDATFSSGVSAVLDLREEFHAILAGESTGGKPNSYGEIKSLALPNSKLTIYYSTKYFQAMRDADPPSVEPDLIVPLSIDDFLTGRDPVLETALAHPFEAN
jgi:C-terminal processing protease CtpA/Prc